MGRRSTVAGGWGEWRRKRTGQRWWTTVLDDPTTTATQLTYAFPTSAAAYTADFPNPSETNYPFPDVSENGVVVRTITTFTAVPLCVQAEIKLNASTDPSPDAWS